MNKFKRKLLLILLWLIGMYALMVGVFYAALLVTDAVWAFAAAIVAYALIGTPTFAWVRNYGEEVIL